MAKFKLNIKRAPKLGANQFIGVDGSIWTTLTSQDIMSDEIRGFVSAPLMYDDGSFRGRFGEGITWLNSN